MGVYDRTYWREPGRPGGPGAPGGGMGGRRPWWHTVNAWLIVICIAFFVIDGFFGAVGGALETGRYWVVQPDGTWVEAVGTPFFGSQDRPEETRLGPTEVQERIGLVQPDGSVVQTVVMGIPVLAMDGTPLAIAEGHYATPLNRALHFSTKKVIGGAELWRLIGFQFLHANLTHLLFNMIALYFFGPLIEQYLGRKRYLAFYLLCGIAGALLYLLLNLSGYLWVESAGLPALPGLLINATGTPLIGASAGVFGVLVGGAFLAPNVMVLVFFILPMRLATLAWVLIVIAIASIFIGVDNAGGEAAHLGGAMAGWGLIRHPDRLHRFFDWLGRFDPTSRYFRSSGASPRPGRSGPGTDDIDRILAKIGREGLGSLTKKERRMLQEASRRDGG